MSELPRNRASRLRRPSWKDARLVGGVALLALGIAGGASVVANADDTVPVYAAARPLVPGQKIGPDDLRVVHVQIGDGAADYLPASEESKTEGFALRPVGEGELVPAAAMGPAAEADRKAVDVPVSSASGNGLSVGTVVDVWVSKPKGEGSQSFSEPEQALTDAVVARTPQERGGLGSGLADGSVTLAVPSDAVSVLVGAVDSGSKVTLVPRPGAR